jgi:hypothetical protein
MTGPHPQDLERTLKGMKDSERKLKAKLETEERRCRCVVTSHAHLHRPTESSVLCHGQVVGELPLVHGVHQTKSGPAFAGAWR